MAVQARLDVDNTPFVLSGNTLVREAETISRIIGRADPIEPKTVMARNGTQWLPLDDVNPAATPALLTCGALGATLAAFQAVTDGEFSVTVDGVDLELAGIDFSDIDAPTDTPSTLTCGANGGVIGAYTAVNNAAFNITVSGVAHDIGPVDLTGATTFADVKDQLDVACAPYGIRCLYDETADVFSFVTIKTGRLAVLAGLAAPAAGTDISGAAFLNGLAAVAVAGTGGIGATIQSVLSAAAAGRFDVELDAENNRMLFLSTTTGQTSAITVLGPLAVPVGTDISGAGFLNGVAGVVTAATGFDDINIPAGIYVGDQILAATVAAADVDNCPILVGGNATINSGQIVLEGALTLASVIVPQHRTVFDALNAIGLTPEDVINISEYENT
jgi:hypothetical protein